MSLKLFTLPPSPHNTKVRLALRLKGLEFEAIPVDFVDRAKVVEVSGQPLTPVLVDGDKVVYDSFGIVRYLDANWPAKRLFPSDRDGMRAVEAWERFAVSELGTQLGAVAGQMFSGTIDDEATQRAKAAFEVLPQRIEDALAESPFLMGDEPTIADLTVAPFLRYVAGAPTDFPEGTPMRFVAERVDLPATFTRTHVWLDRVFELDAVPA